LKTSLCCACSFTCEMHVRPFYTVSEWKLFGNKCLGLFETIHQVTCIFEIPQQEQYTQAHLVICPKYTHEHEGPQGLSASVYISGKSNIWILPIRQQIMLPHQFLLTLSSQTNFWPVIKGCFVVRWAAFYKVLGLK